MVQSYSFVLKISHDSLQICMIVRLNNTRDLFRRGADNYE